MTFVDENSLLVEALLDVPDDLSALKVSKENQPLGADCMDTVARAVLFLATTVGEVALYITEKFRDRARKTLFFIGYIGWGLSAARALLQTIDRVGFALSFVLLAHWSALLLCLSVNPLITTRLAHHMHWFVFMPIAFARMMAATPVNYLIGKRLKTLYQLFPKKEKEGWRLRISIWGTHKQERMKQLFIATAEERKSAWQLRVKNRRRAFERLMMVVVIVFNHVPFIPMVSIENLAGALEVMWRRLICWVSADKVFKVACCYGIGAVLGLPAFMR